MQIHVCEPPGDILVFLTGEEEIEDACKKITKEVQQMGDQASSLKQPHLVHVLSFLHSPVIVWNVTLWHQHFLTCVGQVVRHLKHCHCLCGCFCMLQAIYPQLMFAGRAHQDFPSVLHLATPAATEDF